MTFVADGTVYAEDKPASFDRCVMDVFNQFNNINFLVARVKPYMKFGRLQSEVGALYADLAVGDLIEEYQIPIKGEVPGNEEGIEIIAHTILAEHLGIEPRIGLVSLAERGSAP